MHFNELDNGNEFSSLLTSFRPEEIELIIDDIKLEENGTQFIYIIDTYDIVQNYMPYIETELFSKRSINYQAQKHLCYDYFFNTFNPINIVLLDEYKIELLSAKDILLRHLRDAKILISNIEELKKGTKDFLSIQNNETEAFFGKNFEVILVLLILNDKGKRVLDNFITFIRERLILSETQTKKIDNSGQIEEIILSSKPTEFSKIVFEKYVDDKCKYILQKEDEQARYIFLENTFRDIQVIERVININKKLSDDGHNYKAIYLSSANKTKDIISTFNSLNSGHETAPPISCAVNRNIYQLFLYGQILDENKNNITAGLDFLTRLKKIIEINQNTILERNNFYEKIESTDILNRLKKIYEKYSNNLDNHFYLNVFENYRQTFQQLSKLQTNVKLKREEIMNIIDEIDKNKEAYKTKIAEFNFSLSQLNSTRQD